MIQKEYKKNKLENNLINKIILATDFHRYYYDMTPLTFLWNKNVGTFSFLQYTMNTVLI